MGNNKKSMWIKTEEGYLVNLNHAFCIYTRKGRVHKCDYYEVCCEMPSSGQISFECDTDTNIYILFKCDEYMCGEMMKELEERLGIEVE